MTPLAPTGRRPGRGMLAGVAEDLGAMGAVGIAVLLNVALVLIVLGIAFPSHHGVRDAADGTAAATLPPKEVAALDPSCDGDAYLRAAAQAAVCITPLADDFDRCIDETRARLQSEITLCHVDRIEAMPEVAFVEPKQVEKVKPIDAEPLLEPLTPEQMKEFIEKVQPTLNQPLPPPPPPPPPPQETKIIETPKPATEEKPDDARFVSEYDSKVEKETVNHENGYEPMVEKPKPAELTPKNQPKETTTPDKPDDSPPGKNDDAPKNPGMMSMRQPGSPDRATTQQEQKTAGSTTGSNGPDGDGAPKKGDGAVEQQQQHPVETPQGQGGGGGGKARAPNLRPDDETLERLVGGGSVDETDDVDEGESNAFNTRRWIYASFFNRMKRFIFQEWNPQDVWRATDPDGSHYGFKNRTTVLRVSLDAKGKVVKAVVIEPSGVDALDDEAIRALKAAAPFPNVPAAILDTSGLATFNFGFTLDLSQHDTSWKIYRSS